MAKPIDHVDPVDLLSTVQTRVWLEEHEWLHEIFRSSLNTTPRFRLSDLLSACISIALASRDSERALVAYLDGQLTRRDPRTPRRTCHMFKAQFEQLITAHRASWNREPHPMFDLDHLATACVAVVRLHDEAINKVLAQARENFLARSPVDGRRMLSS
jgi:hypothetical protein